MIGILGGTFDPVHLGHLYIAKTLLEKLPLEEVRFLPCFKPVHRDQPLASVEDRLAMLELALTNQPQLSLDLREIHRGGESFMIDTLKSFRHDFPDTPLGLILGADAFTHIQSWHHWQQLIDFTHFIIVDRDNFDLITPSPWIEKHTNDVDLLAQSPAGLIYYEHITTPNISGTEIRQMIKAGQNLNNQLPSAVAHYIKEHNLYIS